LTYQVSQVGFPIRKSSDQRVFAPPRRLSQRITSFIACACQGIHQLPLRHLIILIANAHHSCLAHEPHPKSLATFWGHAPSWRTITVRNVLRPSAVVRCSQALPRKAGKRCAWQKRPASRDLSDGAVRQPIICRRLSVSRRRTTGSSPRNSNKSSLHDVMQNRRKTEAFRKLLLRVISHSPKGHHGGAGRDRTDDILLAKQALSQLSYGPIFPGLRRRRRHASPWLARHQARRPVGLADAFRIRGARHTDAVPDKIGGPGRT
jgi:hypothetical protein